MLLLHHLTQNPPEDVRKMMMMIGAAQSHHLNPANQTQNHPWDPFEEPTSPPVASSFSFSHLLDSLAALHRYHPSNNDSLEPDPDLDLPVDAFSCDHFRMYEFKVRRCVRGRSHDWTECPYAHLGEKARRRDPRKCHYSGTACPDYRKGGCTKGDACEYSHGVFECWLHPSRYRTQPCKDGPACRRRVCFFAHTPDQLRVLPQHSPKGNGSGLNQLESGSPVRHHLVSSPTSVLATPSDSPPMSPSSPRVMSELVDYMRALQLGKIKMGPNCPSWGVRGGSKFALPRAAPLLKPKLCTPYSTPSRMTRSIFGEMDFWYGCLEEPAMERVEFGRDLRTKIYAKLSKENSLDLSDSKISAPDVGWVSELVN